MEKKELSFYVITPLTAEWIAYDRDDEDWDMKGTVNLDGRTLLDFESSIREYLEMENNRLADNGNLAVYLPSELCEKVERFEPTVTRCAGKLCGCAKIVLKEELTEKEWNVLLDEITGQYSDGWGEGFEQRDIPVSDGVLNVHFWQPGQDRPAVLNVLSELTRMKDKLPSRPQSRKREER